MTYTETVEWLFQQFPAYQYVGASAYKPSLENIERLCAHFGNPQEHLRFIHVAGTNGKGSTCSMLASILTESGEKVGLFTSPHIRDFRERIRINGEMISEEYVINQTAVFRSNELDFAPSFFEMSFLMALLYFQQEKCTVCVIETGLGGRLDATNVITPLISVITNISIEHTQFLGNTITSIAREKAGIIKENVPVVIGETEGESSRVFLEVATGKHAPIVFADQENRTIPSDFPLIGAYQRRNYCTVQSTLHVLANDFPVTLEHLRKGLLNLAHNSGFYGRLQVVDQEPLTLFDVSHNPAGIRETLSAIRELNKGQLLIVYGTSADKDLGEIFALFPTDAQYFFSEFSNQRSARMTQLKENSEKSMLEGHFFSDPKKALASAQSIANKEDTILVFGSFFLLSDFF